MWLIKTLFSYNINYEDHCILTRSIIILIDPLDCEKGDRRPENKKAGILKYRLHVINLIWDLGLFH
jgi:hypothetical protein